MTLNQIEKLFEYVKQKNRIDLETGDPWFQGSETFFNNIKNEIDEAKEEADDNKQCLLEVELGDILWDYLHLVLNLENEGKIKVENILPRALKKFDERVNGIQNNKKWDDIKQIQKQELLVEQEELENKI